MPYLNGKQVLGVSKVNISKGAITKTVNELPERGDFGFLYFVPEDADIANAVIAKGPEVEEEIGTTFYVSKDGSDEFGDGTEEAPFATIEKVIQFAVDEGWGLSGVIQVIMQSNAEWGVKRLSAYEFKLIIEGGGKYILTNNSSYTSMGGNVEFRNTTLECLLLGLNGHDAVFTDESTFNSLNISDITLGKFGDNSHINPVVYSNDISVNIETNIEKVRLGCRDGFTVHKGSINLEYDYNHISPTFYLGTTKDSSSSVVFEKPVNINIKNALGISVKYIERFRFEKDGCIQLMNATGKTISFNKTELEKVANTNPTLKDKLWMYDTHLLKDGVVSFTDVAGKLKVNFEDSDNFIMAIDANGNTHVSEDGFLTVPAGSYSLIGKNRLYSHYTWDNGAFKKI